MNILRSRSHNGITNHSRKSQVNTRGVEKILTREREKELAIDDKKEV
jgi:hypothetical protein